MLIATSTTLALYCPFCGKLDFHEISLFAFTGSNRYKICCDCGNIKATVGTHSRKRYWLQIPCVICETQHLIFFPSRDFWTDKVTKVYCSATNLELGCIGPRDQVQHVVENCRYELESLVQELGYDDYFTSPEIMFETINRIHDIAEQGGLFCSCGNTQIGVEIFPDKLELTCPLCNSMRVVYARTREDLADIRGRETIELANGRKTFPKRKR